jgi:hypothetical protein
MEISYTPKKWAGAASCPADEAASLLFSSSLLNRYRQIRRSRTGDRIDNSSARNLSAVIYVFGGFEMGGIAAFEIGIVEVCGVDTVIPNNCTTINLVRVA